MAAMDLARTAPNVLVTRTFSKMYGLAAERIGWGYASTEIIAAMHRIRLPFSITIAGTAAAIAALGDTDFVAHTREHNAKWRAWFTGEIASLGNNGLRAIPSQANFVLVLFEGGSYRRASVQGPDGRRLYRPLAARPGPAARLAHHHRHRGRDARRRGVASRYGRGGMMPLLNPSPSPFRRVAAPSLSRREREGARDAQRRGKVEGD